MKSKVGILKEQIEEMRSTKLKDDNRTVGEVAKESTVEEWCRSPAEALVTTVLAMRQRWNETAKPRVDSFKKNYSSVVTVHDLKLLMDSMNETDFC